MIREITVILFILSSSIVTTAQVRERERGLISEPQSRVYAPQLQLPQTSPVRIGVQVLNQETGVLLQQVSPGSPAGLAGLEPGDLVVSVDGFQVGYVKGQLYDLGDEIQRQIRTKSRVRLLVQDSRTMRLTNISLDVRARHNIVSGVINWTGQAVPASSTVHLRLIDLGNPGGYRVPVAEQAISPITNPPMRFLFLYDPNSLVVGRQYGLHATLEYRGATLFRTPYVLPVFSGIPMPNVNLTMQPVTTSVIPVPGSTPGPASGIGQVQVWFTKYLNRDMRARERVLWRSHLDRGGSASQVQETILGSDEFYGLCQSDDDRYIGRLYELIAQRQPVRSEVAHWRQELDRCNHVRLPFVREFIQNVNVENDRPRGEIVFEVNAMKGEGRVEVAGVGADSIKRANIHLMKDGRAELRFPSERFGQLLRFSGQWRPGLVGGYALTITEGFGFDGAAARGAIDISSRGRVRKVDITGLTAGRRFNVYFRND